MKYIKIFLLFFAATALVTAQSKPADVLAKLQHKFNNVSDFSSDFKESGKGSLSGKFYYKKKSKFRLELKTMNIASDGKTTWNYNVKNKKCIINNYDESDPTLISLDKFVYSYPAKCNVSSAGTENGCEIIKLTPKNGGLSFNSAKIWIDGFDMIRKIMIENQNGTSVTIELSNIKLNQKLSDSLFSITPPEGSKIIDLR